MKALVSLISAASLSVACGSQDLTDSASEPASQIPKEIHQAIPQSEPEAAQTGSSARLLPSIDDAGKCTGDRIGELVYVATEEIFYHCSKQFIWESIDLRGADGEDGEDGADGRAGRNGKDGQDGKDGRDGINGSSAAFVPSAVYESNLFSQQMCDGLYGSDWCGLKDVQIVLMNDDWAWMTANINESETDFINGHNQQNTTINKFVQADSNGDFALELGHIYNYDTPTVDSLPCHWLVWDTSEERASVRVTDWCLDDYRTGFEVDYGITITTFDAAQ